MPKVVLIIGSAPEAVEARRIDGRHVDQIVAINNAWRVREDWTYLVHPEDFPEERRPEPTPAQRLITHQDYVPSNNRFGGVVYAGGTMVFSAAYWILDALRPDIMAFCGCDMVYERHKGPSHFYGFGQADPLRRDPTLQSLEAKANRLAVIAANENCLCVNLSSLPQSKLTFPRMDPSWLGQNLTRFQEERLADMRSLIVEHALAEVVALEARQNIIVPTGDYWTVAGGLDAEVLSSIDGLWLTVLAGQAD